MCNQFLLMLFKAQTKDPKRSWFDFFYTVFFGNVCKCSLQKKKPKKKIKIYRKLKNSLNFLLTYFDC